MTQQAYFSEYSKLTVSFPSSLFRSVEVMGQRNVVSGLDKDPESTRTSRMQWIRRNLLN